MSRTIPSGIQSAVAAEQNQPIELFEVFLDNETLYYAGHPSNIIFGVQTYTAIGGGRSPIRTTNELDVDEVTLTVDNIDRFFADKVIKDEFIGRNLVVKKVFLDELDSASKYVVVFDGKMDEPVIDQNKFQVKVRSWLDAIHHTTPRRMFSTLCNYQLYDSDCGITKAITSNQNNGTAIASSTTKVVVASIFTAYPNQHFNEGTIKMDTGSNAPLGREILDFDSSSMSATLRIGFPFTVNSGDTFTIYRGCRKGVSDCISRFNNYVNYGGFTTIPKHPLI